MRTFAPRPRQEEERSLQRVDERGWMEFWPRMPRSKIAAFDDGIPGPIWGPGKGRQGFRSTKGFDY
ncbi:hypothetical protein RB213_006608 [Colletotrichum asianum]